MTLLEIKQKAAVCLQSQKEHIGAVTIFQDIDLQLNALRRLKALKLSSRYRKLFSSIHYQQALAYLEYLQNPPVGGLAAIYQQQLVEDAQDHLYWAEVGEPVVYAGNTDMFGWQHGIVERTKILLTYCNVLRLVGPELVVDESEVKRGWRMLRTAQLAEPDNEDVIREMELWGEFVTQKTSSPHLE